MKGTAKDGSPAKVTVWGYMEEPVEEGVEGIGRAEGRLFFPGGVLVVDDIQCSDKKGRVVIHLETSYCGHGCCFVVGELLVESCYEVDLEAPLSWDNLVLLLIGIPYLRDDICNVSNVVKLELIPVVVGGV